ncbi:MAG: asparaginase [Myxococcales bacterium]|nr:asparaginase [Myxococcales bacterium]|tara:strand:- start:336 stop:1268 length:933 start_codon:yes stop_codon:yes gene_type:complete
MTQAVIAIHGGAGSFEGLKWRQEAPFRENMALACEAAAAHQGDAVEMALAAVAQMEQSGAFNAGKGSVLNENGDQYLDGAVARGWDANFGAVAHVSATYSVAHLAKAVMERSAHSFLVGAGADALAKDLNLPALELPNAALQKVYRELKDGEKQKEKLGTFSFGGETDTVGAVALDTQGRLAAVGSTGGTWLKALGRVGDTPVLGSGFYADTHRAVCATGVGEILMRGLAATRVAQCCMDGLSPQKATEKVSKVLAEMFEVDSAGFIALSHDGQLGFAMNTKGMGRAFWRIGEAQGPQQAIWPHEDLKPL